ncbi:MAG: DUF4142 domain-containing protein [Pseudobdellovibrionaceae bacterium]|nr:DUF4142 domain-containing protein [Pseudobdellovibrionaceae bacterium]
MSVFTKICAGLLISTLGMSAYAAQTQPQTPVQEPAQPTVDFSSPSEVIQVLHVGVSSESKIIDLVRERNPDEAMVQFIDQLSTDITEFNRRLEELASNMSVSLAPEQLSENAQVIESQMAQELQTLTQKQEGEFRPAVIEALVNKYEQALQLYTEVEKVTTDEGLKTAIAEFRPITQKHLDDIKALQTATTQPTQPTQPAQPMPVE